MQNSGHKSLYLITCLFLVITLMSFRGSWGFYAHRLINKMAIFTLPPEMMVLFKPHLIFISEHAVDPDKRRYATRYEAVRHYIDLDVWGDSPFDTLPKQWNMAVLKFCTLKWKLGGDRSTVLSGFEIWEDLMEGDPVRLQIDSVDVFVDGQHFMDFFNACILPGYYDDMWQVVEDSVRHYLDVGAAPCDGVLVKESLSEHGILPYHLVSMQRKLTRLFLDGKKGQILRCASDMGHYIGDAHVPLHTTQNYNGQLTNQLGIHAFWESRIPELFAEAQYDFLVGKAEYIEDPESFYWNMVLESHALVDSVLLIEKRLSGTVPEDQQYCFEERLMSVTRLPCEEYARTYQDEMAGMVEDRMQASIHAIGSAWYTAWVDAGQPDFDKYPSVDDTTMEWESMPTDTLDLAKRRLH